MGRKTPEHIRKVVMDSVSSNPDDSKILAVYLFGSRATEDQGDESDIDIAFLLDEGYYRSDPVKASAPAYLAAARIGLEMDCETDVVILNAASLEMAYEIITTGVRLLTTDEEKSVLYEITRKGMFYDFKPFLTNLRTRSIENP